MKVTKIQFVGGQQSLLVEDTIGSISQQLEAGKQLIKLQVVDGKTTWVNRDTIAFLQEYTTAKGLNSALERIAIDPSGRLRRMR
jgi:hypothetical protein